VLGPGPAQLRFGLVDVDEEALSVGPEGKARLRARRQAHNLHRPAHCGARGLAELLVGDQAAGAAVEGLARCCLLSTHDGAQEARDVLAMHHVHRL